MWGLVGPYGSLKLPLRAAETTRFPDSGASERPKTRDFVIGVLPKVMVALLSTKNLRNFTPTSLRTHERTNPRNHESTHLRTYEPTNGRNSQGVSGICVSTSIKKAISRIQLATNGGRRVILSLLSFNYIVYH